jgi:glycosyltransferase involved in cell wall biosynthesis
LENGKWGKLVPVKDVEALAVAIENTLDECNLPNVAQRAQNFELDKAVDLYLELLLDNN